MFIALAVIAGIFAAIAAYVFLGAFIHKALYKWSWNGADSEECSIREAFRICGAVLPPVAIVAIAVWQLIKLAIRGGRALGELCG